MLLKPQLRELTLLWGDYCLILSGVLNETKHVVKLDAALTEDEVEEEFILWRSGYVDSYWKRVEE